jgi:hypothetical protein
MSISPFCFPFSLSSLSDDRSLRPRIRFRREGMSPPSLADLIIGMFFVTYIDKINGGQFAVLAL